MIFVNEFKQIHQINKQNITFLQKKNSYLSEKQDFPIYKKGKRLLITAGNMTTQHVKNMLRKILRDDFGVK